MLKKNTIISQCQLHLELAVGVPESQKFSFSQDDEHKFIISQYSKLENLATSNIWYIKLIFSVFL